MTRLLLLLLLLTSCAVDHRSAQARAISNLAKTYDVSELDHDALLIIVDSRKLIPCGRFGFYDPARKEIIIHKYASRHIVQHEYDHYYKHQLGINLQDHHKRRIKWQNLQN